MVKNLKVAIRADASLQIGTGHVMRCATLGTQLREQGVDVYFICRSMPGDYCDWLEMQGFTVCRLPAVASTINPAQDITTRSYWLGVSVEQEIRDSRAVLVEHPPVDWLIVDHYGLDALWQREMRPYVAKILVIDDLADRMHDCDLLLDQNLFSNANERYQGKVPAYCGMMLGPEYALLQREYAELHPLILPRSGKVQRILVSFGGHGYAELVDIVITAFLSLTRPDIHLDIVVGSDNPKYEGIRAKVAGLANIHLHNKLPTLAKLMAQADLAIGASGATSWERCCLGLPSLVISLAENQKPIANELNRRGLIRWLGHFNEVNEQVIRRVLSETLENSQTEKWSRACWQLLDGRGVKRVATVMFAQANASLAIRPATFSDEKLLFRWANDPAVRANAFSSEFISATTHKSWLKKRLENPDKYRIYIFEMEQIIPLGQVRFELDENGWMVDYSIDSLFRGRRFGKRVLKEAISKLVMDIGACKILGEVKTENLASRKVFEALGFKWQLGDSKIAYSLTNH